MSSLLFAAAFAVVCGDFAAEAIAIPKFDQTCLPTNAAPATNFKPEQAFDGKNWYAIAGPPIPPAANFDCYFLNATFDASSKNITLTQTIITNGTSLVDTVVFAQDPDSNAVYNYDVKIASTQLAVVDTDNTIYTVMTICARSGHQQAAPIVLARTAQTPSNYDAIFAKLTAEGFPTDSAHLAPLNTASCPN